MMNRPMGPLPTQEPAPNILDTAARAFAEILVHGTREYFKSPRFDELMSFAAQQPQPIMRPVTTEAQPLRGCPWCAAAHHLAGIGAYLEHAFHSRYKAAFMVQAHNSAKELVDRIRVTPADLGTLGADVQELVDRLGAIVPSLDTRTADITLPDGANQERIALLMEIRSLIAHCFTKSEEPHPTQSMPPGAMNGQQQRR